ncbi:uncharacterized protein LOC113381884 [Ctenocephalides felis]|uniref:uncharacterized protein LOC113381884 n=1 Tax=Ctenocephalides felis TaxID=7515 RepID=UPI000E6E17A6|nr:uncharacterized protein LOC113381884 [Ctenocephalides felis]
MPFVYQIVYWDDKSIFMEHRFISCSDQFILAIAICRQRLISCDARDAIGRLLENPLAPAPKIPNNETTKQGSITVEKSVNLSSTDLEAGLVSLDNKSLAQSNGSIIINEKYKPAMPLEVAKWIESNEISSAILRSGC